MRILIYTGKGGVGKTSISAATALCLSKKGKKVLIMSTDQAHSLGDSFDLSLGHEPEQISPNLCALEIDPVFESEKAWGNLRDYLRQIIRNRANDGMDADEVLLFPGLDELFSLLRILDEAESGNYDVIIVDCAPTGETLSLLRYPERLSYLADRLLSPVRSFTKTFGGLVSRRTSVPRPRDEVFAEFDRLVKRLTRLRKILSDRDTTSLRLVMTPERIVFEEARRSYAWINAFDYGIDGVYINKIYPDEALKGYFSGWTKMQEDVLKKAEVSFGKSRIFRLLLQSEEVRGFSMLDLISERLYAGEDPSEIFCTEEVFRMEDEGGVRNLVIFLPNIKEEDILISQEGENLQLVIKNEMRVFHLPDEVNRRKMTGWTYEGHELRIKFEHE